MHLRLWDGQRTPRSRAPHARVDCRSRRAPRDQPSAPHRGSVPMSLEHINPADLPTPQTYTQVIVATGSRLIFVAGQVAEDAQGNLVGAGDVAVQARRACGRRGAGAPWLPHRGRRDRSGRRHIASSVNSGILGSLMPDGWQPCLPLSTSPPPLTPTSLPRAVLPTAS